MPCHPPIRGEAQFSTGGTATRSVAVCCSVRRGVTGVARSASPSSPDRSEVWTRTGEVGGIFHGRARAKVGNVPRRFRGGLGATRLTASVRMPCHPPGGVARPLGRAAAKKPLDKFGAANYDA